ncbi:AI-2E family transporter [Bradyrhizobium liaoningense]|uniref:AI-2E family transporter n=1 Tax=Bradyrhizobium liaoningense TaxID=43992 RepID=UPI001BA86D3D|nr:AI-2E family transporter [Bradyrhizobium liaoningense]MBR0841099.1 AI-2E family transporter [Bradyrhizobium liaoningense]
MSDSRTAPERVHEIVLHDDSVDKSRETGQPSILTTGLTLIAVGVALFLVWQTVSSLLIVFAGVLFAAFLDAAARALAPVLPLSRAWRLTLVLLLLSAISGFGLVWGAGKLPEQTRLLLKVMDSQVDILQEHLLSYGVDLLGPEWGRDFAQWLFADQGRFLSHAHFLLGGASSLLTGVLVVLFLGILFGFDPTSHRESLVALVRPSYRARARAVMDEMGSVMRLWFVGQLIRIILMTACVWLALYLIGLPGPFVLGLQAGLSNFIPYLGPIIAAIPIALVAMPLGASLLVWSVVVYSIIQSIEGYVIGPLIQRKAVETPPAWTLVAIVLLGALFGVMGIALAMPLVAIGRVAVIRFYVEDYLGDDLEPATNKRE